MLLISSALNPRAILLETIKDPSHEGQKVPSGCESVQLTQIEREIDARLIQVGDILKILPRMQIPIDGHVQVGESTVDESMITGESTLVGKTTGTTLIGGSVNQNGCIQMVAEKTLNESTLANIAKLVETV